MMDKNEKEYFAKAYQVLNDAINQERALQDIVSEYPGTLEAWKALKNSIIQGMTLQETLAIIEAIKKNNSLFTPDPRQMNLILGWMADTLEQSVIHEGVDIIEQLGKDKLLEGYELMMGRTFGRLIPYAWKSVSDQLKAVTIITNIMPAETTRLLHLAISARKWDIVKCCIRQLESQGQLESSVDIDTTTLLDAYVELINIVFKLTELPCDSVLEKISPLISKTKQLSAIIGINFLNQHIKDPRLTPDIHLLTCFLVQVTDQGRADLIPVFLAGGANAAQTSPDGSNALNRITAPDAYKGWTLTNAQYQEMIEIILESNANALKGHYRGYGAPGNTPLHNVIYKKEWQLVEYFIEKGADLDTISDSTKKTARDRLLESDCPEKILRQISNQAAQVR